MLPNNVFCLQGRILRENRESPAVHVPKMKWATFTFFEHFKYPHYHMSLAVPVQAVPNKISKTTD